MRICLFSIAAFFAAAACGQAVVEHAAATAGTSAAAAGTSGAGKSIGGVFRSLNDTLDKAGTGKESGNNQATSTPTTAAPKATAATVTTSTVPSKRSSPAIHASQPIDPSQVTEGLDGAELVQRFGPPVWRVSEKSNARMVESLWYKTNAAHVTPYNPASDEVEIKLIDGKVVSVIPPAPTKKAEPHN